MLLIINNHVENDYLGEHEGNALGEICRDICGTDFRVEHFSKVNGEYLKDHPELRGIIAGGSSCSGWDDMHYDTFAGEMEVLRQADLPCLGICWGHLVLALAYGGTGHRVDFGKEERFFHRVKKIRECELLEGLDDEMTFWEYHILAVNRLPEGFEIFAETPKTPIQGMRKTGEKKFGVMFHPEQFDGEHPDGRRVLENFCKLATR